MFIRILRYLMSTILIFLMFLFLTRFFRLKILFLFDKPEAMKKMDGFPGQISFVLPEKILERVRRNRLISDLYITDIGYYPRAQFHFRARTVGCPQNILIYNIEGSGEIWVENTRHLLPPDHFFIIPADKPHRYFSTGGDPWSIYWIHFTGEKAGLFCRYSQQPAYIERNKFSRIAERIQLFEEIFLILERGYSIETLEYVNLCLGRLLATFSHLSQFSNMTSQSPPDAVSRSINYMLENLRHKLYLEDLAREAGLSASHFSRLFTRQTGHSPIDYFNQLKIQHACRLLDNTSLTVKEVAGELGFEDQFYFSRTFHKVMNLSPLKYRSKLKG